MPVILLRLIAPWPNTLGKDTAGSGCTSFGGVESLHPARGGEELEARRAQPAEELLLLRRVPVGLTERIQVGQAPQARAVQDPADGHEVRHHPGTAQELDVVVGHRDRKSTRLN